MRKFAFLCASVVLSAAPAFGVVVYQQPNEAGSVNVNGNAIASLGDDVTLAGTERNLVSIDIGTRFFFAVPDHVAYTGPITLSLYDTTTPGTDGTAPGQLIAQSSAVTTFAGTSGSQDQTVTFLFNPLTTVVPNSFYLAVSQDVFENNFALIYGSGPTVGTTATAEFFRFQSSTNFSAGNIGGVTGLKATINAIPEPATLSLVAAAGLLALRRRRQA